MSGSTAGSRWPEALGLLALYLIGVTAYALAGTVIEVPIISPDEYTYGPLARSIADGDGLSLHGGPFDVRSPLYMYLTAPLWAIGGNEQAFELTKLFGAAVATAVVFPTWLLARTFVGARLALVPAALSIAGAWMTITGLVVTENLALPLGVAALAAMVPAVTRPGWRWSAVALGLTLLAAWARSQLVVLPLVLVLAILVDVWCHEPRWRERLREHRHVLLPAAAFVVVAPIIAIASPSVLGRYSGLATDSLNLDRAGNAGKDQLSALLVLSGFLPLLVTLAGSLRRDVWRDRALAPLLAVTWSAALVLVVQSAAAVAFWKTAWSIERYLIYCVPLLLVAMTVLLARGLVAWRTLAGVAGGAALLALSIPGVRSYIEEPALFGLNRRTDALLGASAAAGMAVVLALAAGAVALAIHRWASRPQAVALVAALLTGLVLVVQSQSTWAHRDASTSYWRSGFPQSLTWIDDQVKGDVAHFVVFRPAFRHPVTAFFNSRVKRVYAFDRYPTSTDNLFGRVCSWTMDDDGYVTFQRTCGAAPTRLLINEEAVSVTFYDQRVLAYERDVGRVVEIPARRPRILAMATPSCSTVLPIVEDKDTGRLLPRMPLQCNQTFGTNLFLDKPATLVATFRGGQSQGIVAMGAEQRPIAPLATVKLRSRQPAGATNVLMAVQPSGPAPAYPQLISLELVQDGKRTQLLY